ncbi:MAG: PAS domain S-box protein [Candidatus Omnitrophota bacterium]
MEYLIISNVITFFFLILFLCRCFKHICSTKTFTRVIEHSNIGFCRCRARDGILLDVNAGFIKILELDIKPAELKGRSIKELVIHIEENNFLIDHLRLRGEIRNREYFFKTLKGKDKCVLLNSYLVKNTFTDNEIVEIVIEDITEEKFSYERMKESQERYEKLFRHSGDMVIICGLENFAVEEVNPVTEVITGYSGEELKNVPLEELLHPYRRSDLKECRKDLLFAGASRMETVVVCKNGTYKEVLLTLSLVEIKEETMAMAVVKDVSSFVHDREEQKRRKKELEEFWKASVEREQRIKDLRLETERLKGQIKLFKEKHEGRL